MPVTKTRSRFNSTRSTFPSCFLNFPRNTFTLSPLRTCIALVPCFCRKSLERWTWTNFCRTCRGALYLYLRCLRGWVLLFQLVENFFFFSVILYYHACYFCHCRPSFRYFLGDRPFEDSPFWVSFFIFQYYCGIIFKFDSGSISSTVFFTLSDNNCVHDCFPHF